MTKLTSYILKKAAFYPIIYKRMDIYGVYFLSDDLYVCHMPHLL